jgi:hypothetical protein
MDGASQKWKDYSLLQRTSRWLARLQAEKYFLPGACPCKK